MKGDYPEAYMKKQTNRSNSSKKRIIFFIASLQRGGAERVVSIITKYLAERDFKVEILLYYNRPILYQVSPNIKITVVEKETNSRNMIKNMFWMRNFFKKNADIVISFLAPFNIMAVLAHWGLSSKIIVADRSDPWLEPKKEVLRKLRNFAYLMADGVVLQTQRNKTYFSSTIQKKSVVIYNPVDLGDKKGLALKTSKKDRIVCVARFDPQKNHKMLLEAFARIKDKFPTYTITFYGKGPLKESLQNTAKFLEVEKHVFSPGVTKNIFEEIADAKLFVLPSNYEGMPNALAEAMCLGLPVISTDVSGASELIEEGKSGFIVPNNSPEKMANIIQKVLSDDTLQKQFGEQAIKLNDKLDVSTIVKQWEDFIIKTEGK